MTEIVFFKLISVLILSWSCTHATRAFHNEIVEDVKEDLMIPNEIPIGAVARAWLAI